MSKEVLDACIRKVKGYSGTQLVLHHFGEPFLHPELTARLEQIASSGLSAQLSTNGLLLERMWPTLIQTSMPIRVMISVHQWVDDTEAAYFRALDYWRKRARGTNVNIMAAYNIKNGRYAFHRWAAGQLQPWDATACLFVRMNLAVVLWNGDIVNCCVDHEGETARYNILEVQHDHHKTTTWEACSTCDVGRIMQSEDWQA